MHNFNVANASSGIDFFKPPVIKVIGVGGGGGNVVDRMIFEGIDGVDYCVMNTDVAVLRQSKAATKIAIGKKLTKGQGAGMMPDIGKSAALEDVSEIEHYLQGADIVFIAVGMGGGTGTGAAPVVAQISKEFGILTVGVVTIPFKFEGKKRSLIALQGIEELKKHTDTLMIIPNDRLLEIAGNDNRIITVLESFIMADDVLKQAISGLTMLINRTGVINLDFADVKTVMKNKGKAIIGIGHGVGEGRGLTAAKRAIQSPILNEVNIKGATGAIINIVADREFTLIDARDTASYIESYGTEDAHVMFGLVYDDNLVNEVSVTVIATGFENASTIIEKKITVSHTFEKFQESIINEKKVELDRESKIIHITGNKIHSALEIEGLNESLKKDDKLINDDGLVELELTKEHLQHVEKDPFYPRTVKNDRLKNDKDFPAFLRRHREKNQ